MTDAPALVARHSVPKLTLTGREWKLYLVGLLGTAYTASLLAVAHPATPPAAVGSIPVDPRATSSSAPAATWLTERPSGARPVVNLPAGWAVADPSAGAPGSPSPGTSAGATGAPSPPAPPILPRAQVPRIMTRTS